LLKTKLFTYWRFYRMVEVGTGLPQHSLQQKRKTMQQPTIQCRTCGLMNWANVPACVRCNTPFYYNQPQSWQGQPGLPPRKNPIMALSGKELITYIGAALGMLLIVLGFVYKVNRNLSKPAPKAQPTTAPTARPAPPVPARPAPSLQDAFYERSIRSDVRAFIATTEVNYLDLTQALTANDQSAISKMRAEGKILEVKSGTKVKIIENGKVSSRVTVLDGTHAGKGGRIANEYLTRSPQIQTR
jgi:hypothetical protein